MKPLLPGERIQLNSEASGLQVEVEFIRANEPCGAMIDGEHVSFVPCERQAGESSPATGTWLNWWLLFITSLLIRLHPRRDPRYLSEVRRTTALNAQPLWDVAQAAKEAILPYAYRSYDETRGDFLRLEAKCDEFLRLVATLFAAVIAGVGAKVLPLGGGVLLALGALLLAAIILALSRMASPKPALTAISEIRQTMRLPGVEPEWIAGCLAVSETEIQAAATIRSRHLNAAIWCIVAFFIGLALQVGLKFLAPA